MILYLYIELCILESCIYYDCVYIYIYIYEFYLFIYLFFKKKHIQKERDSNTKLYYKIY